jgi:alanine-synthesizing transaminase
MFNKSDKLSQVCYDIRGEVHRQAKLMEEEGYRILKLNIGNPAPFGFNAPDEVLHDMILNLSKAQGYSDSKGVFSARKAIMQDWQRRGRRDVDIEDIYLGNGVSELIVMSMQSLLNNGDEVLLPAPDYPLWTAAVSLAGGKPVHYICDESSDWYPDLEDIRRKVSDRTRALVLINPNNPTGSVYSREVLEGLLKIALENNLILYADEIYDRIVYDDAVHIPMATLDEDVKCVSFGGLSKNYRAAGFRAGWMTLTGNWKDGMGYREGLDILASMRLCPNVPAQYAIQTSLGGYQSINDLVLPRGRLREQRDIAYDLLTQIPGISCVKPKGALYLFPKLDIKRWNIQNDEKFVYDLLVEKKILVVQGTGFNWAQPDHMRLVFLPNKDDLREALGNIADFLEDYRQIP